MFHLAPYRVRAAGFLSCLGMAAAAWFPAAPAAGQADVLAPAHASAAELFDLLPADTELAVMVPSLREFSDRLAAMGQSTGLTAYAPDLEDALTAFKQQMSFSVGVDDEGPMVVVVQNVAAAAWAGVQDAAAAAEPRAVLLVPVTDYAAFIEQLGGDAAAEGPTAVTLAGETSGFARRIEGFAVLGSAESLEGFAPAEAGEALLGSLGTLPGGVVDAGSALVYVDLAAVGPDVRDSLAAAMQRLEQDMLEDQNRGPGAVPAEVANAMRSAMKLYGGIAATLAEGGDKLVLGLSVDEAGVMVDAGLKLVEGSDLAGYFPEVARGEAASAAPLNGADAASAAAPEAGATSTPTQAADAAETAADQANQAGEAAAQQPEASPDDAAAEAVEAEAPEAEAMASETGITPDHAAASSTPAARLLASLPDEPWIVATTLDARGFAAEALIDRLLATINDLPGDAGMSLARPYLDSMTLMKNARGFASVFYVPQPASMMTGGFFSSLTVYEVDDADAFLAGWRQCVTALGETRIDLPAAGPDQPAGAITFTTRFVDDALMIDGTPVHQYAINLVLPHAMMQQFGPLSALMGNTGQTGYLAARGNRVIATTVADPQLVTRGLAALDADAGLGRSGPIADLRDARLPDHAWAETYFNLAGVVQTVNPFLPMLMPGGQSLEVPADLPPLAVAATSDGQAVLIRGVLPTDLVRFGVDTWQQLAPALPANTPPPPRQGPPRAPR